MKRTMSCIAGAGVAALFAAPAIAATPPEVVDLNEWDTAPLIQGWSAEGLLDQDVYGPTGENIGEV